MAAFLLVFLGADFAAFLTAVFFGAGFLEGAFFAGFLAIALVAPFFVAEDGAELFFTGAFLGSGFLASFFFAGFFEVAPASFIVVLLNLLVGDSATVTAI